MAAKKKPEVKLSKKEEKSATKEAKSEEKSATKAAKKEVAASPVHVDDSSARSDEDARVGQFAEVVKGEHAGRYGVLDVVSTYNTENGFPETVVLITRDDDNDRLVLNYADLRPAKAGRRV